VKKFIIMAVSLLLTALLALAGCMYAIGENKAESKPYDMGETVSVAPEDTPTAQEEMEQKFSVYNHVTEENGKKILTLFSEEQAEEQWTKRENGEEFRLTYDEILFLINDSARLYETYDEIVLTNSYAYGISELSESSLAGERIVSNKGEYEGATYAEEKRAYADWRYHVTLIAAYRVAMLDSRMRKVEELYLGSSSGISHGQKVFFDDEKMDISGLVEMCRTQWIMIPDDTEWETEEAYRQALRDQMDHHFWVSHANCEHPETPYFVLAFGFHSSFFLTYSPFDTLAGVGTVRWGAAPEEEDSTTWTEPHHAENLGVRLFPGEESSAVPDWELKELYIEIDEANNVAMGLFHGDAELAYWTPSAEDKASLRRWLGDAGEAVKRYVTAEESYTLEEAGGYFLEVDLGNGTSLLYPPLASNNGEYALGCIVETRLRTYETYENLSFRPFLPREFVLKVCSLMLPKIQRFLPKVPVETMEGTVFVGWQTEHTPYLVLGENGKGYLHEMSEKNLVLPVEYEIKSDGDLHVWCKNKDGETVLYQVYKCALEWDAKVYSYSAEESKGYGDYLFPDGALFYEYVR
jgi:hypothetical protein